MTHHGQPSGSLMSVGDSDDGHSGPQLGHPQGRTATSGEGDDGLRLRYLSDLRERAARQDRADLDTVWRSG
jgi:hypothetical protein